MQIRDYVFDFSKKTYIAGILNVTPDSFSDPGEHFEVNAAVDAALSMIREGASLIDIGGESTRPGYTPVEAETEIGRVVPVIKALRAKSDIPVSIDTTKAEVAEQAIRAGADIVNDVSGLMADDRMFEVIKNTGVYCVITHNVNYLDSIYNDGGYREGKYSEGNYREESYIEGKYSEGNYIGRSYVNQVLDELDMLTQRAAEAGIPLDRIILDSGVGFKGSVENDHIILDNLSKFGVCKLPIMLGTSRKSCISSVVGEDISNRDIATGVISAMAYLAGIEFVRVHNVKENAVAIRMMEEICKYG